MSSVEKQEGNCIHICGALDLKIAAIAQKYWFPGANKLGAVV